MTDTYTDEFWFEGDLNAAAQTIGRIVPGLIQTLDSAPRSTNPKRVVSLAVMTALDALSQACAYANLDGWEDRLPRYKARVSDWADDPFRSEGIPALIADLKRPMVSVSVASKSPQAFLNATGEVIDALAKVLDMVGHSGGSFLRQWRKYLGSAQVKGWRDAFKQVESTMLNAHDLRILQELSKGTVR